MTRRLETARLALRQPVAIAFAVALAVSACNTQPRFGPVPDAETAASAALVLSGLQPPLTVVGEVTHGVSGELYDGPRGMCGNAQMCRESEARLHRLAWKVNVQGMAHGMSCEEAVCPLVKVNQVLIIDELEGKVLYSTVSEGFIGF